MPPVAGDWDGNGLSEVGYNEPSNGMFVLRTALTGDSAFTFVFGTTNGLPVAGKWIAGNQPNLRPILSGRPGDIENNNVVPIGTGD